MHNIIPIISGKGGVGKSTVAVNLAVALAKTGAKVALVDCDFYGPSIPTLFGGGHVQTDHEGKLIPPEKFGVKYISLGFFLQNPDDPIMWRGPMFNKALTQLFQDVSWGVVDYCIVDMPPGTGDAQLSLAQSIQSVGAIVVTTPQEVALADVRKAVNMLSKVNIDVLGIVENMSGFKLPDGSVQHIFGQGGGEQIAAKFNVPLLAKLPIDIAIREGCDAGTPIADTGDSESTKIFLELAAKVSKIIDEKAASQPVLKIVN